MSLPSTWHIKLLLERHFFQCDMLNYYWSVTSFNVTCYIIGASLPLTWHVILERHFLQHDILYYWSVTSFNMTYYNIGVSLPSTRHIILLEIDFLQLDILYHWSITSFNVTRYIILNSHFPQRDTLLLQSDIIYFKYKVKSYWEVTSLKKDTLYYWIISSSKLKHHFGSPLPSREIHLKLDCHLLQYNMLNQVLLKSYLYLYYIFY